MTFVSSFLFGIQNIISKDKYHFRDRLEMYLGHINCNLRHFRLALIDWIIFKFSSL